MLVHGYLCSRLLSSGFCFLIANWHPKEAPSQDSMAEADAAIEEERVSMEEDAGAVEGDYAEEEFLPEGEMVD